MTKSIGKFISSLRKTNGYTQEELGEKIGVSNKTISSWENDNSYPDLKMLPILADLFNVTCDELLRGEKVRETITSISNEIKGEKNKKYILNSYLNRYGVTRYISLGIFLIAVFLFWLGLSFNNGNINGDIILGWIFMAVGVILYLVGLTYSIVSYNNAQNKVLESENSFNYFAKLDSKNLLIKCLYSFFLFTPLFCYLHNKKLLNKERYKLNDNTIAKLIKNLKLKKILYIIGLLIWLIGIIVGLIIEWIPSQYLNKEKYHLSREEVQTIIAVIVFSLTLIEIFIYYKKKEKIKY